MNSPLLSEGTGGTDNQQLLRSGRSAGTNNQISGHRNSSYFMKRTDSSLSLEGYLLQMTQNNDIQEVQQQLSKNIDLDITYIVDQKKYSLLHFAAFNNSHPVVILLINHVQNQLRRQGKDEQEIKIAVSVWVNRQTDDEFTAIHFAAYRGNWRMIEYLQQQGADIRMRNKHGMNVLHIAAQGDQPISLAYFKYEGVSFQQLDVKGGTALHWAAFYGCEQATNYILAWNQININQQDNEGLSPLHLACMSGNSRVVKKLITKGANKHLKNNEGKTPADIARENEFVNIERMLAEKTNIFTEYFNVKTSKQKSSRAQIYKFLIMFLIVILCQQILHYRNKNKNENEEKEKILWAIDAIVQILLFIVFLIICCKNPGYLGVKKKKIQKIQLLDSKPLVTLLKRYECFDVCPECEIVRPPRSKHCDICGMCVGVYDHHCPWINNCVGKNNHGLFYIFVTYLLLDIPFQIFLYVLFYINISEIEWSHQDLLYITFATIGLTICIVFFFPILLLWAVQSKNLLVGKTTYERFSNQAQLRLNSDIRLAASNIQHSNISIKDSLIVRKQNYSIKNCLQMCCRNAKNQEYSEDQKSLENSLKTVEKSDHRDNYI